ncbi:hypothetical protein EA004_24455 [Vibrio anguillarum]|uniref:Hydrolase protein n=2 Tax=Vibrio anguillarum TaxID=55601 RepID=A0AAW4B3Q8_VIBAN|nr:recombinase family protein [Vibrio anguillarum]ASF92173.1 hypothetical protein CEA93_09050 [Vibrio anguillarum]AVT67771.1 hypothetical protein B5S57_11445 [Vibrio anguillarum]MBF4217251.1 hypothetical protein [Vibrio anguillarum]MBF4222232.1 hypothetical protein [Vibrio anguillarum]
MVNNKNQGTNGGEAYKQKCNAYWESVRFQVELAYLTEGSYSAAARELNRKRVPTMHGANWHPQTVSDAISHYAELDKFNGDY